MTSRDPAPVELTTSNLLYRRPEWYDEVQADPNHTVARQVEQAVAEHAPTARTLLDIGCGTGRDMEHLAERFDCVGVDVQPNLVAYARRVRPGLDVRVGDMRSFRLGRQVDVITCLGNSLAYLDDADLPAAFATFDAHDRARCSSSRPSPDRSSSSPGRTGSTRPACTGRSPSRTSGESRSTR